MCNLRHCFFYRSATSFHFNEVQSMEYLEEEETLYATFTTPESGIAGAAVCSYKMSDVEEKAFGSKFLHSDGPTDQAVWRVVADADHSAFECRGQSTSRPRPATTSTDYQLVSASARPAAAGPVYHVMLNVLCSGRKESCKQCYVV